ncbi:hypothetical protein BT96DRAFT_932623 [Gymnopus androsaceus JB14]|uniref:Uncharacterized protein n=1 Tax=Gymnopus androsaceus JB14 TaxID=1447944 RepID=A0A6A4ICU7_9AGAR|nr:hypothetical protein BT96DRAFT_932623 [Gymnopus androsaceus JB14]
MSTDDSMPQEIRLQAIWDSKDTMTVQEAQSILPPSLDISTGLPTTACDIYKTFHAYTSDVQTAFENDKHSKELRGKSDSSNNHGTNQNGHNRWKTHNGGGLGSANPGIGLSTTGLNDGGGTGATNQKNNNQNTGHKYGPRTNVATALEQDGVTCKFLAVLRVPILSLFLPQL